MNKLMLNVVVNCVKSRDVSIFFHVFFMLFHVSVSVCIARVVIGCLFARSLQDLDDKESVPQHSVVTCDLCSYDLLRALEKDLGVLRC